MFQPMYQSDAEIVTTLGVLATPRGSITASTAIVLNDSNYTITLPITLSAHQQINVMINNSPTSIQAFVGGGTYQSLRGNRVFPNQPNASIANPNFEQNWVQVGTIPLNSTSAVVTNIPTRWMRLEGQSFTATNFYAFVWTQKMAQGY